MSLKRTFGALLTILGIAGLICTTVVFIKKSGDVNEAILLTVYGVLGFIIFMTGVSLVRNTKDEA
ncbi:hypothetical protein AAGV33_07755 [Flavobacterium sp. FBOR7N2.3]|uniref:Uncharacterized protein n=1 Tax=Flavobacterium magnesitis TaxID=3138077 RepID=A0ABV4TM86_9FLAO